LTDLERDIVIPDEFRVADDGPRRRAFEDAVAWCSQQTDDRLCWLRFKIARRLVRGSFFEERLFRTEPRENIVFLMIVSANLRRIREHFDQEALPARGPVALLEESRPC
jgi:hypothetical protein